MVVTPHSRSRPVLLSVLLLILLALAATVPLAARAQEEPQPPGRTLPNPLPRPGLPPRPLPLPRPGLPPGPLPPPPIIQPPQPAPSPGSQALSFGPGAAREPNIPTVTAGDTFTRSIPLGCAFGPATADLSVTVDPPAFSATVSPTRVTTPASFTLTAATLPTTPATEYRLTITAKTVSGPCNSNSTTLVLLVERPVRLEVQPANQTIQAGASTSYNVTIRRGNFSGPVSLRATGLPPDVKPTFSPDKTRGNTSTLALNVAPGSTSCPPPGGCDFRIRGDAGVEVQPVAARLVVSKAVRLQPDTPSMSITTGQTATFAIRVLRSGYAGPVELRAQVIESPPSSPPSQAFDIDYEPNGFTTAEIVNFRVKIRTGAGRYRFRLTPTLPAGMPSDVALGSTEVTVEATPPRGVDITVTPASISIPAGGNATYRIQIIKSGVPSVRFGISGLPPKATAIPDREIDPTSVRITTAPDTPDRTYTLTVFGTYEEDGRFVSQDANRVDLVVGPALGGSGVSLSGDGVTRDIDVGSSRTFPLTLRPQGSFRGMVTLDFQPPPGSPALGASFSPQTVDLSSGNPASSTLTLTVPAGTSPGGPFQGLVTGRPLPSGSMSSTPVNYRILSPDQPALSLRLSPPNFGSVQSGDSFDVTATVTRSGGCVGQITLFGTVFPVTALGAIDFLPVPGSPDTFRARITAGPVTRSTVTTLQVTASVQGCASALASTTGTVRPRFFVPPGLNGGGLDNGPVGGFRPVLP